MKKQLFSFLMVLALVVLAGTSAMAQNNAATNASAARYYMVTGSTHTFSITKTNAANAVAWTLVPEASQTETNTVTPSDNQFTVTWNQAASGNYYVQAIETRDGIACATTTRRFYINVVDFDVLVYVSDASGNEITGTNLSACGAGNNTNYANDPAGTAFNNIFNANGVLDGYNGVVANVNASHPAYTERYISLAIVWTGNASTNQPTYDHITFNYLATVNHGLVSVNSLAPTGTAMDGTSGAISGGVPALSNGAYNGGAGTVVTTAAQKQSTLPSRPSGVAATATYQVYTIPVRFADRWAGATYADIVSTFRAQEVALISENSNTLGREPRSKQAASGTDPLMNTSAAQTIQLAPATTPISVAAQN